MMDTKKLFSVAKANGIDEIEVYSVEKSESSISSFNNTIDDIQSSKTKVSYIRGAYNGQLGAMYVENDNISEEKIVETIKTNAGLITNDEPYFIYPGSESYPELKPFEGDFSEHTLAEKQALCLDLAKKITNAHEYVATCPGTSYEEEYFTYTIENSNGLSVKKSGGFAYLVGQVVIKKGEEVKSGFDVQIAKKFADFDLDKLVSNLVLDTVKELGGAPCVSGDYKVVIKNSVMRSLLGAFSGVFSAEAAIQKISFLVGKENSQIFGDNITIIDDPLCELAPSQDSFDDEGVASFKKTIVDKGVFKTFLHNLKTAKIMGCETTANGYKNGVSSGVSTRPSNLYIKPGDKSLDELFALCGDGFYLTSVAGLHAGINMISGDFSLQSSGFEIKDGKLGNPINLVVTSGNIKELLNNVIEVGNDLDFKTSSIGAPALLVSKLSVSGK